MFAGELPSIGLLADLLPLFDSPKIGGMMPFFFFFFFFQVTREIRLASPYKGRLGWCPLP